MAGYVLVRSNWTSINSKSLDLVCDVGFEENNQPTPVDKQDDDANLRLVFYILFSRKMRTFLIYPSGIIIILNVIRSYSKIRLMNRLKEYFSDEIIHQFLKILFRKTDPSDEDVTNIILRSNDTDTREDPVIILSVVHPDEHHIISIQLLSNAKHIEVKDNLSFDMFFYF
jgi:hypothetical protein